MDADRQWPHDLEAERAVLGAALVYNEGATLVSWLEPAAFYRAGHRTMWEAIQQLSRTGRPFDPMVLRHALGDRLEDVGGVAYISGLVDGVPRSTNIEQYARRVREKAALRALALTGFRLGEKAQAEAEDAESLIAEAEAALYALSRGTTTTDFESAESIIAADTLHALGALLRGEGAGLPTGLIDLDAATSGLHAGQVVVLAARPGQGKSALAMQIAEYVAGQQRGAVAVASLEMARGELMLRLVIATARVSTARVKAGRVRPEEYERLTTAMERLGGLAIHIDDGMDLNIPLLRSKLRRLHARAGLALLIVDYLQLIRSAKRAESREQAVAEISRGLKGLSKELTVPVLALSQLNRESERRGDKKPQLSDLRESGSLEQDADSVWLLHRPEVYDPTPENAGIAEVILAKQRHGPTGSIRLTWNGDQTRFDNYTGAQR